MSNSPQEKSPGSDFQNNQRVNNAGATGPRKFTRRSVIKTGALVGVALPLIVTLLPSEAQAQDTGGS